MDKCNGDRKNLNNAQYHPEGYQSAHALFSIVLGSNQKRNDKTRVILSKFFGSSWANEYIEQNLFEC